MSNPIINTPKGSVTISLHKLYVEVVHEASYPDQMTDISNRAKELFESVLKLAQESKVDIRSFDYDEIEDEFEED